MTGQNGGMLRYAEELKRKRQIAGLTLRQLASQVDRSPTLLNDFELGRKSNPPDPDLMASIAAALDWPERSQLEYWGYDMGTQEGVELTPAQADLIETVKRRKISDLTAMTLMATLNAMEPKE